MTLFPGSKINNLCNYFVIAEERDKNRDIPRRFTVENVERYSVEGQIIEGAIRENVESYDQKQSKFRKRFIPALVSMGVIAGLTLADIFSVPLNCDPSFYPIFNSIVTTAIVGDLVVCPLWYYYSRTKKNISLKKSFEHKLAEFTNFDYLKEFNESSKVQR